MKKLLTLILCLIVSGTAYAQISSVPTFPDVSQDSKYFISIEDFASKGFVQGYTDGTFRPDNPANRAEALKIILLSSNIEVNLAETGGNIFPDVTPDDWFYPYIKKALQMEIVEGYEDGYFRPIQNMNIAETLKIILLTNGVDVSAYASGSENFPDVDDSLWFSAFAAYAKDKNIIEPQNDGNLNAGRSITRGELVELMYRTQIVIANDGEAFDISTNWKEVEYPQYKFKTKVPFDWKIVNNEDEVVFWHPDTVNHQSSYEVPYPYSSEVVFHLDLNEAGLTQQQYIDNLEMVYKSDFGSYQKTNMSIGGYTTLNLNVSPVHNDYYVFLPENEVLQIYTSYGWSDLTDYLKEQISKVLEHTTYITSGSPSVISDLASEARNRILVEGIGQETLDLFTDLINIETDTIGVGTGPIDYFYSDQYDITLKYERASDTILDIQNGQTSAF